MKETRFFYCPDADRDTELPAEEAIHAVRVLRLREGDEIYLMDGKGTFYRAEVTLSSQKHCFYSIKERLPQKKAWGGHIHLAIAPTKDMGRMEWMAEKATEIGFDELSFLNCKFSERKVIRQDRIDKIVVSATKQSRKAWKPIVNEMTDFDTFISQPRSGRKFICHCYGEVEKADYFNLVSSTPSDGAVTVLVGPEGDFSIDEVRKALSMGYESVSLGRSRLRTETAGLMTVAMSQIALRLL